MANLLNINSGIALKRKNENTAATGGSLLSNLSRFNARAISGATNPLNTTTKAISVTPSTVNATTNNKFNTTAISGSTNSPSNGFTHSKSTAPLEIKQNTSGSLPSSINSNPVNSFKPEDNFNNTKGFTTKTATAIATVPQVNSSFIKPAAQTSTEIGKARLDELNTDNEKWNKVTQALSTGSSYKSTGGTDVVDISHSYLDNALKKVVAQDGNALSSGNSFLSAYNSLSSDDKWDVYQNLQNAKNKLSQALAAADNAGNKDAYNQYATIYNYVDTYDKIISEADKGSKSLGKSIGDWLSQGGFVGGMAQPIVNSIGDASQTLGNEAGGATSKFIGDKNATINEGNHGLVKAADTIGGLVGNTGMAIATGGMSGLISGSLGLQHALSSAVNDTDRNYYTDTDGNLQRQNKTDQQKWADLGTAGLSLGMNLLGMAGVGPNIKFANNQTFQNLVASKDYGTIAKGLLTYAAKEIPWAAANSAVETGISVLGQGDGVSSLLDANNWSNYGESLLNNILGDVAMDVTGMIKEGSTGERDLFRQNQETGRIELDESIKSKLSDEDNAKIQKNLDDFQNGVKEALENGRVDENGNIRLEQEVKNEQTETTKIDLSRVRTGQDGSMVKINADNTISKLSDAELAKVAMGQVATPQTEGLTPFRDNEVGFRSGNDNIDALAKRAEQGDTYAQKRLAELTKQGQDEPTDWRGKSVDEVINPRGAETSPDANTEDTAQNYKPTEEDIRKIQDNFNRQKNEPQVAIGVEPLGKAADGTPEFVKRYTEQKTLDGVDNSKQARQSRLKQVMESFKKSDNPIVKKFYELSHGDRLKSTVAKLSEAEAKRYAAEGGVPIANDAKFIMTQNFVKHEDNDGHLTGIRRNPEPTTGIGIDANPLTTTDIGMLDTLVKNPDTITNVGRVRDGQRLKIEKQIDNNYRIIADVISDGKELNLVSYYKQNKNPLTGRLADLQENPVSNAGVQVKPSDTRFNTADQHLNNSISQNDESVNSKQSRFANETVQNSEEVSDAVKTQTRQDQISYRPTSNAEHLAKSEEFMKSRTLSQAEADITDRVLNQKIGKISDQDVSDAIAVAKALDAKGDNASMERASAIYESLSQHATKKGQEIQALSLLNNRTPEGLRYGAEKAIKKSGTEVTPEIHKQVVADTNNITAARTSLKKAQSEYDAVSKKATELYSRDNKGKSITRADYRRIMQELSTTGRKLDNAKHELDVSYATLSKTVSDNTKQTVGNIYTSIHKAGLLSAPTTHIRNLVSNATFHGMGKISDAGAAAIDNLVSLFTGKRTKTFTMKGEGEGFVKGARYGLETMKTGVDELNGAGGKYTSGFPELKFKNSKLADTIIGKPDRIIFRAMSAGDKPFRYQTQANSLYDQATATAKNLGLSGKAQDIFVKQFVTDPPQAALTKAVVDGERAVLGQDNMVASSVNALVKKLENSDSLGAKAVGTFLDAQVVPFVKVPTNFLIEAANYTPIGAAKETFKLANDAVKGRGFDQRAFSESISKSALGTAGLVALGAALSDIFTGEYPDDNSERNRWEAEGIKENSLKIGDRYVPLDTFGPAALLIGAGAQFSKSMKEGNSWFDATGDALSQFTRNLSDQSFLTGVSEVMDLVNGDSTLGNTATNYLKQAISSEVPNMVKKLASATDPYMRNTGKKSDIASQTIAQLMNSIPGLRELLPAKVDNYGNDLKNGAFLTGFLDPTGSGFELQGDNEMIAEVARLHNVAGDLDLTDDEKKELEVTPSDVSYTFGASGSQVTLTDDEQRELTKLTGGLISSAWQDIMDSDDYKNSDDLRKARLLADGRAAATNLAKQQFAEAHGYTAPKMTTDAKALANGTYVASAKNSDGTARNNPIEISANLASEYSATIKKYNSMTSSEWNDYLYGQNTESAAAEYNLAKAKYENDLADGNLTDVQKITRQKELSKLEVSQNWTKNYRDAYSLASSKADMQAYLNGLDENVRAQTVSILNGLNNAMYEAGIISETTYKTRGRAINNITASSSKSKYGGITSAETSALSSLAKTLSTNTGSKARTTNAPTTKRKLGGASSSGYSNGGLASYTPKSNKMSVSQGVKRSIA